MTVRFAHDSKVTVKIKLYVTARGEGNRFNYIDEYDVEGTVSKDIMETRSNLNVIIKTKLYEKCSIWHT